MTVQFRDRALAASVLVGLVSSLSLAASPVAAAQRAASPAGSTAHRVAIPVQDDASNFRISWQPGGSDTDLLIAQGTVTVSDEKESYTIEGELSIGGSVQNCNWFHGGTKMSVRRDGEEWAPQGSERWGWKQISEERTCNELHFKPVHFEYTGKWDVGDLAVLIDIRSNPIVGSYMYSDNARCAMQAGKLNC
ncbi:hypothetical protein ACFY12_20455 [Streptomyces sp. NPDC001339]|uniref:hypothetical protein n=1 Tax=Streptomyces sp. NPDC001339 TaxID=3364563 RepID=UPI00368BFFB2